MTKMRISVVLWNNKLDSTITALFLFVSAPELSESLLVTPLLSYHTHNLTSMDEGFAVLCCPAIQKYAVKVSDG